MYVRPNLADVRLADVVVIGRISNYRIVRNEPGLVSGHARFDVQVDEVLVGRASGRLSVTWYNSTFAVPDQMPAGTYLIALRRPGSTIMPSPDPNALTPLQAPCSSAFILEIGSEEAGIVRWFLDSRPRQ